MARKSSVKGARSKRRKKTTAAGGEETPITISGGSIKIEFDQDFEEDQAGSTKKVKKLKHPKATAEFTRLIVSLGKLEADQSNIITQFPLNQGCFIYIRSKK